MATKHATLSLSYTNLSIHLIELLKNPIYIIYFCYVFLVKYTEYK